MDSSSSPSIKFSSKWTYDVFISFCGIDTRRGFVSHLLASLRNAAIETYIETYIDSQLHKGTELSRAIESSRISIIVFSKNYTHSSWCLDELQKIMECSRTRGQFVVPVFYDVEPSDVRLQKGEFGQALIDTARRISTKGKMEHVLSNWRKALTEAASLSGWDANYRLINTLSVCFILIIILHGIEMDWCSKLLTRFQVTW